MRRRALALLIAAGCVGLGGLAQVLRKRGLAPGSRPYEPVSARESAFFTRAARDVYPDDVRHDLDRYRKTLVSWAGVVRSFQVSKEDDATVLRFDVEHRYFDWIEDVGLQKARYFLARKGEGAFRAAWSMAHEAFRAASKELHEGDMLVVYGYPAEIRGEVVGLFPTEYVRLIGAELYDDGRLDYGRRGDDHRGPG
jgi:hypothetical protein